jgi:phosphatidylglycerol:prolipoprotein diacylglycerol transferase
MFPNSLAVGGVHFSIFGLIAAASLLIGYWITALEMRRLKIPSEILPNLALATLLSSFLCARLFFVGLNWQEYVKKPVEIFFVWEGGLVLYGGILGALLGGFLYCLATKRSFFMLADPIALGVSLGLALSRLGCLALGCCFGKPTHMPWGITFHDPASIARPLDTPLHPTQLYFLLTGLATFLILFFFRKKKKFEGETLLGFLFLTALSRVFIEPFRADSNIFTYWISFSIFVACIVLYYLLNRPNKRRVL